MATTLTTGSTQQPRLNLPPVAVTESGLLSSLRAIKIVFYRELIRFVTDKVRIISTLIQPVLNIFVLGTGLSVLTNGSSGVNLRTFIYPGALAMCVLFTAVFSAGSIVWDREFGFMREMYVAPISRTSIVLGKCLGGTVTSLLQGVLVLLVAGLADIPYSPVMMLELLGELALLAFALTAFGVMAAARVATFQGFMGLTQMFLMPLFFTAGAMFPLNNLPTWLSVITRINPLAYAIDPVRRTVFDRLNISPAVRAMYAHGVTWNGWNVPVGLELAVVFAMGAIMLGIAILEFRKAE